MTLEYAAGFFDGEGCVRLVHNITVIISGCFRVETLQGFVDRWGGTVRRQRRSKADIERKKRNRPGIRWEVTGPKALAFLTDIYPYLGEKKDQAEVAMAFAEYKQSSGMCMGIAFTNEQRGVLVSMHRKISALKKPVHDYSEVP